MNADFTLLRDIELPSIRAHAREFEHGPSGARLLHLETDDPENCFALAFSTPPDADHGVPHILEHAVLAGSDRFPVREPFFEMVKSSPAGFINAMTSDLWTVYPICTTLEGDFWNLAEVYADAVFHPLLTLDTFEREGHHLKLEEAGNIASNLERSGIVYNEMKGAFSSPESLVYRSGRNLFPGGALGFESGGDPQAIPELTWEKLRDFHSRFYAPGNCLLVLYGNIPLEKQLDFWGQKLAGIERRPSLAARPSVQKFDAPRFIEEPYAIEPDGDATNATFLSLRWRCGDADALDPLQMMSFEVLQRLLAGHDGAPLKKPSSPRNLVPMCSPSTPRKTSLSKPSTSRSRAANASGHTNLKPSPCACWKMSLPPALVPKRSKRPFAKSLTPPSKSIRSIRCTWQWTWHAMQRRAASLSTPRATARCWKKWDAWPAKMPTISRASSANGSSKTRTAC